MGEPKVGRAYVQAWARHTAVDVKPKLFKPIAEDFFKKAPCTQVGGHVLKKPHNKTSNSRSTTCTVDGTETSISVLGQTSFVCGCCCAAIQFKRARHVREGDVKNETGKGVLSLGVQVCWWQTSLFLPFVRCVCVCMARLQTLHLATVFLWSFL